MLVQLADRLKQSVRRTDKVARVGGDEFVVLITDPGTDVTAFVNRLDETLNDGRFEWKGLKVLGLA